MSNLHRTCPPNMGPHEYLMHLDEPRERPRHQPDYPPDHSRREWLLFEREWLERIQQIPEAAELLHMLLVATKRRPEVRDELKGIWNVLLQGLAESRNVERAKADSER
jgi:hypothetical protein